MQSEPNLLSDNLYNLVTTDSDDVTKGTNLGIRITLIAGFCVVFIMAIVNTYSYIVK